jgi:DNA-binding SARP family transcriptional activator
MTQTLHIQLLGDLYLRRDDTIVATLQSPQEQSLLAYLLLHRGAPQSRQHMAFLFWPDSTEAQARSQLRKLFYRLRQDLPDADTFLYADTQTMCWVLDAPFTLDVAQFERALQAAEQAEASGHREEAREALESAVALYGGDLLPSCYDDWILQERTRLSQRFVRALERLETLLEEQRAYGPAITYAQRLLAHDPLYEPGYRALMRLYASTGNRASALRVYHSCSSTLQRELEVAPSPETRRVYEHLLRSDSIAEPSSLPPAELAGSAPLIGRRQEWGQLLTVWQEVTAGAPQVGVIEGVAGIGKTRLAEELVRWVQRQGAATATAHCYAAEGELPYAPIAQWLRARPPPSLETVWRRELARLLPELLVEDADLTVPGPVNELWQRQRLFEALARAVLGGGQPLLLLIDDLQWCDRETLEWLHYLLRFDQSAQLLLVGTARLEGLEEGHPLSSWLRAIYRAVPLAELTLGPLDETETLALAERVAGRELDAELADCIYAETEGNPLFVVEIVRAGKASDKLELACAPQGLPPRVQATIEDRLAQLSSPAQALVELAAVLGREFALSVLVQASDLDGDILLRALDELWQRRIVREQEGEGYDFTHDKLRQVAYAGLSQVRRRILHQRAAEALGEVYAVELGAVSGQVAAHYEQGGQGRRAIPYYLRAADHARQVYANEEAIGHYEHVLALMPHPTGREDVKRQVRALVGLGQLYLRIGRAAEAEEQLRQAAVLAKEAACSTHLLARLYYWLGQALHDQSHYEEQIQVGKEALALLGEELEPGEAVLIQDTIARGYDFTGNRDLSREIWHNVASLLEGQPYVEELGLGTIYERVFQQYLWDKRVEEAMRWLQILEVKAATAQDERAVADIHHLLEDKLSREGDLAGAIAHLRQALRHVSRTGCITDRSFYTWRLGYRSLLVGDLEDAEEYARAAMRLDRVIGTPFYMGWGEWLLGLVLLCRGSRQEAEACLEQAIAFAREASFPELALLSHQLLGRMYLEGGNQEGALGQYHLAVGLSTPETFLNWRARELKPYPLVFTSLLSGLEEAYADPEAARAFCRAMPGREDFVAGAQRSPDLAQFALTQWFLVPAAPALPVHQLLCETFGPPLSAEWVWYDSFGDCSHIVGAGVEIHAANGRSLWHINESAPRFLRPLSTVLPSPDAVLARCGIAFQTSCCPAAHDKPAIGGLLLWIDKANHVRVDVGMGGAREVTVLGCLDNQDVVVGRGRLSAEEQVRNGQPERVTLRLEWMGDQVRALVSADGEAWFSVGQCALASALSERAQVGVYACGNVDRTVYHGAYPDGAAIRFGSFSVWELAPESA